MGALAQHDWEQRLSQALQQAVCEFNRGDYFECHETLEHVWLDATGDDKIALQGLIQAAAAMIKYRARHQRGVLRLLPQALAKLAVAQTVPFLTARVNVEQFSRDLERLLATITSLQQASSVLDDDDAWSQPVPLLRSF